MAVSPTNQDIYYYANDARTKSYTISSDDWTDMDSADTLTLTIRKKKGGDVVATLSTASEISISGSDSIGYTVSIAFNNDLEERAYVYDLYDNTIDNTLMYGLLIVTQEIHA